jgi:hypothetical protein
MIAFIFNLFIIYAKRLIYPTLQASWLIIE